MWGLRLSGPNLTRGWSALARRLGKMTQFLPPNLLALFAPRDPIPYLPPLEKLPHEKHHNQPYCGIAPYIREFEVSSLSRLEWFWFWDLGREVRDLGAQCLATF